MTRTRLWLLPLLAISAPARAAPEHGGRVTLEYTDFTRDFGEREVATLEYDLDFGDTAIVLTAAQGRREFASVTRSATRGGATVYHDWNDRLSTRTSASIATDDPVFPTLDVAHDFNLRIGRNLVLLAGGRYTRYFGGKDAYSVTAGASYYFRGGLVSYRFTRQDVEGEDAAYGHLVSLRLNDSSGGGFSQIWLGAGTDVRDDDILPGVARGDYRSISGRRLQPLAGPVALDLGLSHAWYDTGLAEYEGTTVRLGLALDFGR